MAALLPVNGAAPSIVGAHVSRYHARGRASIAQHIEAARKEAARDGGAALGVVAIFVGGPRDRTIILGEEEAAELRRYSAATGVRVVAHSAYSAYPWKGDPSAAQHIRAELEACQLAGIGGLVVHLPKLPLTTVRKYLPRLVSAAQGVPVYLETPAVKPTESYYETPAKLAALVAVIQEIDPKLTHFGICVDTAHLWTCGVDLESHEAAAAWFGDFEARLGDLLPAGRVLIHLNDSARLRGVGPDTHAPLLAGKIWGAYGEGGAPLERSGLAAVVDFARRHSVPLILERAPKEALASDYRILRRLGVGALFPHGEAP